jgi:hypothetical protein
MSGRCRCVGLQGKKQDTEIRVLRYMDLEVHWNLTHPRHELAGAA